MKFSRVQVLSELRFISVQKVCLPTTFSLFFVRPLSTVHFLSIASLKISNLSTHVSPSPFLLSSTTILLPYSLDNHECGEDTLEIEHIARRKSFYDDQLQNLLSNLDQSQSAFCFLPKPCLKYEKRWTILFVHAHYL